jgi:hypothetical protein
MYLVDRFAGRRVDARVHRRRKDAPRSDGALAYIAAICTRRVASREDNVRRALRRLVGGAAFVFPLTERRCFRGYQPIVNSA